MQIKGREDAYKAFPTPKSKLRTFERRIYDLKTVTFEQFIIFLIDEKAEIVHSPGIALAKASLEAIIKQKKSINLVKIIPYMGDPLESDFQFRRRARRTRKSTSYLQRFHGRVYLFQDVIIVVIETETDPKDLESGLIHFTEGQNLLTGFQVEHRIIRLIRKDKIKKK